MPSSELQGRIPSPPCADFLPEQPLQLQLHIPTQYSCRSFRCIPTSTFTAPRRVPRLESWPVATSRCTSGCGCAYPQRPFPSRETFRNTTSTDRIALQQTQAHPSCICLAQALKLPYHRPGSSTCGTASHGCSLSTATSRGPAIDAAQQLARRARPVGFCSACGLRGAYFFPFQDSRHMGSVTGWDYRALSAL